MKRNLLLCLVPLLLCFAANAKFNKDNNDTRRTSPKQFPFSTNWKAVADKATITIPADPHMNRYHYSERWKNGSDLSGGKKGAAHHYTELFKVFRRFPAIDLVASAVFLARIEPDSKGIVYVDSAVVIPGDGSSWENALEFLSDAISAARVNTEITEIHVAKGTYYPGGLQANTKRDTAFILDRGGIKLLGGFPNGGGERNYAANPVILSGDINNPKDTSDNIYCIMYIQNIDKAADSLIVDGFTITKANTSLYQYGRVPGGLSITDAFDNTLIRSCRFLENYSLLGAAMMIWGTKGTGLSSLASPQIINCEFSGNTNVFLIDDNSEFLLLPGAIFNFQAAPFFGNCVFKNNKTFYGGVIVNMNSSPVIYNSDFSRNTAWGVSISRVIQDSHMILINCKITDNRNIKLPDGVWDDEVSRGLLSFFDNNILASEGNSSLRLINTTIAGNRSLISADAGKNLIINSNNSSFYMTNSIIWGNQSNSILDTLGMPSKVSYSLIQGKSADATNHNLEGIGVGDIFVDSAGADYRLSANSPVIDAGISDSLLDVTATYTNNDPAGGLDLAASTRIQGSNVDLGAYESTGDVLAVEMGALKGALSHDGHVILSWMTYTEVQNKGFQVQVSLDGIIFRDLVFIPSLASGGNSNARIPYYFDGGAVSGVKYYRVVQIDLNGRRKQSNIVMLKDVLSFQLKAYPNPVHNTLHIQVEGKMAGHARILMVDFSGKLVHKESLAGPGTTVDMQGFAGGAYLVRYLDDTHSSIIKVIKK